MLFVTIFLVCFALLAGAVMFLSRTIEHGEARFDASGKEIREDAAESRPAQPARRMEHDVKDET